MCALKKAEAQIIQAPNATRFIEQRETCWAAQFFTALRTVWTISSLPLYWNLNHDKRFQNNQWGDYSLRLQEKSTDVYADDLPQSTSWWLLCLVVVTVVIMSKGDSLSFIVLTRVLLPHYQYPVNRKCCQSYFTDEKTNTATFMRGER